MYLIRVDRGGLDTRNCSVNDVSESKVETSSYIRLSFSLYPSLKKFYERRHQYSISILVRGMLRYGV